MNTENKLYEKFTWLKQDLIFAGPKGAKAQFKGVALLPTISGNGRKYVEEELHRSARTLVGKPLTLNHNGNKVLGDVTWAEFENGCIEYVAETKNNEYIEKLKDCKRLAKEAYIKKWGRDPIYGVSVEANYRFHDQQCVGGHCTIEPHGIIFNALSLVEDPERPGVSGTTVEIMETLQAERRLSEMIVKDLVPKQLQSSVLTESQKSKVTKMTKLQEQEDEENGGCPEGQHKNENGECVPDKEEKEDEGMMDPESTPDVSMEMLTIKHQLEKDNLKRVKETKTINESIIKTKQSLTKRIEEVAGNQKTCCNRLGETQKLLLEVEGIAKGTMDKQAKEAEELTAKDKELEDEMDKLKDEQKKTEETLAQTVSQTQLTEALGKLPNVEEKLKPIEEKLAGLPDVNALLQPITEKLGGLPDVEALIKESLSKLPDVNALLAPLQETITKQATQLAEFDKKYGTLNNVYEALNTKYEGFVKESEAAKKLKETQDQTKLTEMQQKLEDKDLKLKEMQDQIDTLKLHVSPKFKAKLETKKVEPNFSAPYTYGK